MSFSGSLQDWLVDDDKEEQVIFVGDDWAEDHHDLAVMDDAGRVLARRRLPEGVAGVAACHELIGAHADDPAQVAVGIETDRPR